MFIHVVTQGESLWQIAAANNVTTAALIEVNGLQYPDRLVIGQALIIPSEDFVHIVKPGETLWSIAQTYGTTVQSIIRRNKTINPSAIYPGQQIVIPALTHTVMPGETLYSIARQYGVSLQSLISVNHITNADVIYTGVVLVIPHKPGPAVSVNGYIYILGTNAAPIVEEDAPYLTYLCPFAYLIKEDGTLQAIDDGPAVRAAQAGGIVPMMAMTNFTATSRGENLAHTVLSNPQTVDRLISEAVNLMGTKGYKGLNVDFEAVLPGDRELYNHFLQLASTSLHAQGYFLSTAVAPKNSESQAGLLYEAIDYAAHGRYADFVILMTYEWGYRKGPPQAISPLNEIVRVLNYAVTVIPRNKIYFGFQIYARDWLVPHQPGQEAETFSAQEAVSRAVRYGTVIRYDPVAQSPYFFYTDEQGRGHEVWFEDARSAQAKFDTVKAYGLAGISYWALGYPFPQNWVLLADNFTVNK